MTFKKVFRGYSPEEVEKYIDELEKKYKQMLASQKMHIDELADENYTLRQQVHNYQVNEQAISGTLIESQQLADKMKNDAEKFSEIVLSRAKLFYATWTAYAQTLIATLSDDEIRQFNEIKQKLAKVINVYDGADVDNFTGHAIDEMRVQSHLTVNESAQVADEKPSVVAVTVAEADEPTQEQIDAQLKPLTGAGEQQTAATERVLTNMTNPIEKVAQASGQVIDLKELIHPEESLEDLCKDLGLINKKK